VGRVALVTLALAGLAAPAGLATTTPNWTAKGEVTKLNARTITVNGRSCRITSSSPDRLTLRLYFVGAEVKIACADGVLRAIDVLHPLPAITVGPPTFTRPPPPSSGGPSGSAILTQTISGATTSSASALVGTTSITALGDGSITAGGGSLMLTCTIGAGSPDIGGLQVGDRLTRLEGRNGVLTSLTRA
jgi:hypothetical protein